MSASIFLHSLENINTSQWSNIPSCIIQSINILAEGSRTHHLQLENLKNQLTDLSLKFSVKTGRYDVMIEELNHSFKSMNSDLFKDIQNLKENNKETKDYIDMKLKPFNDSVNDIKGRVAILNTEYRRETREFSNKIEIIKNEANGIYVMNMEKSNKKVDENLNKINKEFYDFSLEMVHLFDESKEKIKDLTKIIEEFDNKITDQNLLI